METKRYEVWIKRGLILETLEHLKEIEVAIKGKNAILELSILHAIGSLESLKKDFGWE